MNQSIIIYVLLILTIFGGIIGIIVWALIKKQTPICAGGFTFYCEGATTADCYPTCHNDEEIFCSELQIQENGNPCRCKDTEKIVWCKGNNLDICRNKDISKACNIIDDNDPKSQPISVLCD